MRYQERIYMDANPSVVRNRAINNVNMSSDICIYGGPEYTVSGAGKIVSGVTTGDSYVHIIESGVDMVNLGFDFTGGTTATTFNIKIYKYDGISAFTDTVVYQTGWLPYTNHFDTSISPYTLDIDGEFLIKVFNVDLVCTDILSRLGVTINTEDYSYGELYGKYVPEKDFYFIGFSDAEQPILNGGGVTESSLTGLRVFPLFPSYEGQNQLVFNNVYESEIVVNVNGLTLSPSYDYTIDNNFINFSGALKNSDIVTIIGVIDGDAANMSYDTFVITSAITSGDTASHPSSGIYYNTDINKYEAYTTLVPTSMPIISLNGVTLAPLVDYTRDENDLKRIIFDDEIWINDLLLIVYATNIPVINEVYESNPVITWRITNLPQNTLGYFIFEVSTSADFSTTAQTEMIPYIVGVGSYTAIINTSSFSPGDTLYYRILNHKVYQTILGENLVRERYSEIIPIIIAN